jgi:hypothetical protein
VIGDLEVIEQQQDPIFASPRDVFLGLVLSIHELEAMQPRCAKRGSRRREAL